jgi:hypothetical protein
VPTIVPTIVPGRRVLLVCALLVAGLSTPAAYWMIKAKPEAGAYIDALALDGGFAVTLREEKTEGRAFVELIGLDEGLRWQALIPTYRVGEGAIGVAAAQHAVTVRFPRAGHTQLFGFSASSAQKLGTIILGEELPDEPDGHAAPAVASLSGGAQAFEVIESDDGAGRIYAISMLRGAIDWTRDLPEAGIEAIWITSDEVVVEQPGTLARIARADGRLTSTLAQRACVAGDQVIAEEDLALAAGERLTGLCGRRGATRVVAIDGPDGAALLIGERRVALGAGTIASEALLRQRASSTSAAPLSGELDRIVPVLVGDRIVGVDLDAAKVAWEAAGVASAPLFDAGVAVLWRDGDILVSIGVATGARRAVRIPDTQPLRPHHLAGSTVWVVGDTGLVALDAATLEPNGSWRRPPGVTRVD